MEPRPKTVQTVYDTFSEALGRLAPEGPLALAVSGGPDSMALLHLACAWNRAQGAERHLTALTVDHGLREESTREAEQVARWAEDLGVHHVTLTWTGDKPTSNVEALAREARYALLSAYCAKHKIETLVTAHHRDDQAETFLMRLMRGSGVSGLAAMSETRWLGPGKSLKLIRPLLEITKEQLKSLLEEVRQGWYEDPGNEDQDFTRSRIRGLADTFATFDLDRERLFSTAQRMSEANEVLLQARDGLWSQAIKVDELGVLRIDRAAYSGALKDTRLRVLSQALQGVSGSRYGPRYDRLSRLDQSIISNGLAGGTTLHGCRVQPDGDFIVIFRELREALKAVLAPGAVAAPWDGRFEIQWDEEALKGESGQGEIRAVGEDGWLQLKEAGVTQEKDLKRDHILVLPAAWIGQNLVALPQISYGPELFKARFILIH